MQKNDKNTELLKKRVELEFGETITDRPGCEALSAKIFEKTGQLISYNTLRRFFGLSGKKYKSGLSKSSFDILARFCGYDHFEQMLLGGSKPDLTQERIYLEIQKYQSRKKIDFDSVFMILENFSDGENYYHFYHQITLLAIVLKDEDFLKAYFQLRPVFKRKHYLQTHIYFTIITLGIQLRGMTDLKKILWEVWAPDPTARKFYFELFVDMDTLLTEHHKAISEYFRYAETDEEILFSDTLLFFKSFMLDEKAEAEKYYRKISEFSIGNNIHPIVAARVLTAKFIYEKEKDGQISKGLIDELYRIEKSLNLFGVEGQMTGFFYYWMAEGLIIAQEYELAGVILDKLSDRPDIESSYYNRGSLERLKTYQSIVYYHLGKIKMSRDVFRKTEPEHYHGFSYSYDRFFYAAAGFLNGEKVSPEIIQNCRELKYEKLAKLLGLPL